MWVRKLVVPFCVLLVLGVVFGLAYHERSKWLPKVAAATYVSPTATITPPAVATLTFTALPPTAAPIATLIPLDSYTVQPGDTFDEIADAYLTDTATLHGFNVTLGDPNTLWVGAVLQVPYLDFQRYTVQPGDGFNQIAERFGLSATQLLFWNRDIDPNWLYVDDVLRIPQRPVSNLASSTVAASTASPALSTPQAVIPSQPSTFDRPMPGDVVEQRGVPDKSSILLVALLRKKIVVSLSEQKMYVYENQTLRWEWWVSTGMAGYPTHTGHFAVQSKLENPYSAAWQVWMPNWLGIYWAGSSENGIHALPILDNGVQIWGGGLGYPQSYGCVILGVEEAQTLWGWAEIGTPVEIVD